MPSKISKKRFWKNIQQINWRKNCGFCCPTQFKISHKHNLTPYCTQSCQNYQSKMMTMTKGYQFDLHHEGDIKDIKLKSALNFHTSFKIKWWVRCWSNWGSDDNHFNNMLPPWRMRHQPWLLVGTTTLIVLFQCLLFIISMFWQVILQVVKKCLSFHQKHDEIPTKPDFSCLFEMKTASQVQPICAISWGFCPLLEHTFLFGWKTQLFHARAKWSSKSKWWQGGCQQSLHQWRSNNESKISFWLA